jgi:antitoxin component YwqK of YwqJK toxin-antitoxin module
MIITGLDPDIVCKIATYLNATNIETLHEVSNHFRDIIKTPDINKLLDNHHWQEGTTRYTDGSISSTGYLKDSRLEGFWKYWWIGGEPRSQGRFYNGKPIGSWIYWDENGNIVMQNIFNYHGHQESWVEVLQGR